VQIESEAARASAAACREQRRQAGEAVTAFSVRGNCSLRLGVATVRFTVHGK